MKGQEYSENQKRALRRWAGMRANTEVSQGESAFTAALVTAHLAMEAGWGRREVLNTMTEWYEEYRR